jgi:hypothetical protein
MWHNVPLLRYSIYDFLKLWISMIHSFNVWQPVASTVKQAQLRWECQQVKKCSVFYGTGMLYYIYKSSYQTLFWARWIHSIHSVICFNIILLHVPQSWVVSSFLVWNQHFYARRSPVFAIGPAELSHHDNWFLIMNLICTFFSSYYFCLCSSKYMLSSQVYSISILLLGWGTAFHTEIIR